LKFFDLVPLFALILPRSQTDNSPLQCEGSIAFGSEVTASDTAFEHRSKIDCPQYLLSLFGLAGRSQARIPARKKSGGKQGMTNWSFLEQRKTWLYGLSY
jgi:hypothetical protein